MRLSIRLALFAVAMVLGLGFTLAITTSVSLADGTEVLGPPSIPIATGTGIVAEGVGLEGDQPANINLNVPLGVTVKQVILYWSGGAIGAGNPGANTVTVNGTLVNGTLIGGPTFFFSRSSGRYDFSTYRADITSLGVVTPGPNSIAIGAMDFGADENNGAGILVIIDDGTTPADIQIRDGIDVAFYNFPGVRQTTVPQVYTFAPQPFARTATLPMFFGSVQRNGTEVMRPSSIEVTTTNTLDPAEPPAVFLFSDKLNSNDGAEWDTLFLSVPIPPGANTLTVQAFSRDDLGTTRVPASFSWLASLFVLPAQQLASLGDYVWEDLNRDGIQDPSEPGLPDVPVTLLDCNDPAGVLDTTTTNAGGFYLFDNLNPGCYEVQFGRPAGYTFTTRNAGANDAIDSDADPITGRSGQVTLGPGEQNLTIDAGLWRSTSSIRLKKFTNGEDADTPTGPEVGLGDVVTWTYDITNTGTVTLTNVTLVDDIEGSITCPLVQLLPGQSMTCVLTGVANTPGQYANTAVVTGTPTIDPTTPVTDTDPSHHIGRVFSLGNRIWRDDGAGGGVANDGVQNGGEGGIDGVTLNLLDGAGNPVLDANNQPITTVTSDNGCFLFDNLRSGDYILEVASANFAAGQSLANHVSSTGNSVNGVAPSPNTDIDLDDNGNDAFVNGAIRSGVVTLSLNSEPLGEQLCGAGHGSALDQNSNLTVDFGFLAPVGVGDFVWFDENGNGLQDAGEPGAPDVTVRIFTANGQPATDVAGAAVPPQVTDASGEYLFTNLPPGSYFVVFDVTTLPAGYVITTPNVGNDDTIDSDANPSTGQTAPTPFLSSGTTDLTLDMGLVQLSTVRIGDYVWIDANVNGRQDLGEAGVPDVRVVLFNAADDQQVAVTQTDANGFYLFGDLPAGQYYVVFDLATLPLGYRVTEQNAAGVPADLDSDADPVTGRTGNSRVLVAGEEDLTLDMGIYGLVSVGDLVWEDLNNNGLVDPGEPGMPDIPVRLFAVDGVTLLATTTTDANGNYRFDDLFPGQYIIEIEAPEGYSSSTGGPPGDPNPPFEPAPSPDNDVDNDDNGTATANPRIIRALPVTLTVGGEPTSPTDEDPNYNPTVDFGVCAGCGETAQTLAAIGDFVWLDEGCNGVQELNSQGVAGITVRLFKANGELVGTTQTNANGLYRFNNLDAGEYFLEFVRPAEFRFSPVKQGENIALDSDAAPIAADSNIGRTTLATLVDGQTDLTWDAGLCSPTNLDPGDEPVQGQTMLFLPVVRR